MEYKDVIIYQLQHLRQLVFEVTDQCNLNCRYCAYSDLYQRYDERKGEMLSVKKARQIIDYIFSIRDRSPDVHYPLHISFYGGEPLLNMPFIKDIMDYLEKKQYTGNYLTYGMTTNAMLLDKYMDFLVEKQVILLISLDGDETSQSYRVDHSGNNSFSRIFKNVKLLQEKYPVYFEKYVQFNSVMHNRNNVEDIVQFFEEQFKKIPLIAPLNTSGIRKDKIPEFRNMFQNIHQSIIHSKNCENIEMQLFTKAPRVLDLTHYIFWKSGNVFDSYNELLFYPDNVDSDMIKTGTCFPFSKKMFITVSGKILQCERIGHDFSLGQVFNDRVALDIDKVSEIYNYYTSKCRKQCSNCFSKNECVQCVYHIDTIHENDPYCPDFCTEKEYMQKKDFTLDFLRRHPHYYEKILTEVTIN